MILGIQNLPSVRASGRILPRDCLASRAQGSTPAQDLHVVQNSSGLKRWKARRWAINSSLKPRRSSGASVTAALDHVDRTLVPAARRLLGRDAAPFLKPLWHMLAATALPLSFDETYPHAHASWLCQQFDDWSAVRAAVEGEPEWAKQPLLRYRLGLASHHLGDVEAAIKLWLPLCWIDPSLFARYAPTLPNATLRDGWEAFERAGSLAESADAMHPATWFPPWLLVRDRRLADLFQPADVPDAGTSSHVFQALLALVPLERRGLSDELIAHRRALQRLSPELFGYYMRTLGGPRLGIPTRG